MEALHKMLNFAWEKEEIPDDWNRGLLVKLTRKGDLSRCGNWRGIMLLTIPSKVLTRVILNRMRVAVDEVLRDEQAGFRKDCSCTDQIATLRIIVEQSIEWSSPLYLLFMDFEKAFDSLDREAMWRILRHYGIPNKHAYGSVSGLYLPSASWRNYDQAPRGQDRSETGIPSIAVAVLCGT